MKIFQTIARSMVVLAVLISGAAWAQVATVSDLSGAAQAIPAAGAPRDLRMGDALQQGDTIRTAAGSRIVLKFEDGQIIALTPNSRFTISNYIYNKAEPTKSNILLSLVDGGMRAITGLIGKAKPENVTYRAANATIGIRGTDISVGTVAGNLSISVTEGGISFTFQGKTTDVRAGEGVDARTDGTLRKAALSEFVNSLTPELKAIFSEFDRIALDRLIRQAGQQDLRENPPSPTTSLTNGRSGSGSGSTGAGGGQNCNVTPRPSGC